jgi:LPS-assembly lipoprotein
MNRRLTRYSLILSTICLLTACGFQLRGVGGAALPPEWKSMYLATNNPNSEFSRSVVAQFAAYGVKWTDSATANFSLVLSPERFEQRNLSLNSEARVAEFELTMSSQFKVLNASNQEVMAPTNVLVVKQMENDPRNVVGKAGEVRLIEGEMRTELAQQILRRIGFFASSAQYSASSPDAAPAPTETPEPAPSSDPAPSPTQ